MASECGRISLRNNLAYNEHVCDEDVQCTSFKRVFAGVIITHTVCIYVEEKHIHNATLMRLTAKYIQRRMAVESIQF